MARPGRAIALTTVDCETADTEPVLDVVCIYPRRDGQAELSWVAAWSYTETAY